MIYWRPGKVSKASLVFLAILAMACLFLVETRKEMRKQPYYDEKVAAVRLQASAMEAIKKEVLRHRRTLDPFTDPAGSGLIGRNLSPLTSVVGSLAAKQTSVNPNFAAVVIQLMKRLGLKEGDRVAVGATGSFPALNLAVLVGCKVLKLRCVMISSVAASMFGANHPRVTWLDMERIAYREGFMDTRSVAASIGGVDDNGAQLSETGVELILRAIERNQVRLIREGSLQANIEKRLQIYEEASGGEPYKAFINIGGGEANVGSHFTKVLFRPGINRSLPRKKIPDEGAMTLLMRKYEIPAIHLSGVSQLAERYGLPKAPRTMPPLAEGALFYDMVYSLPLVAVLMGVLIAACFFVIRFDVGRMFRGVPTRKPPAA